MHEPHHVPIEDFYGSNEVACFSTIFEPVPPFRFVIHELHLPPKVCRAINRCDNFRVLIVVINGEVERRHRGRVHSGLREVQMALMGFPYDPSFGKLRDHSNALAIRIVLGAADKENRED